MKLKSILLMMLLTTLSGCSFFSKDTTGYEDSDSVNDLSVPPELNLPKRDSNYDIPEVVEVSEEESEVMEQVEEAVEKAE